MTEQPSLFAQAQPPQSVVHVGANNVALCTLCTASYPQPEDIGRVTDTQRWADWHASQPHPTRCGGLWLTGGTA